jgi:hypothetical protein
MQHSELLKKGNFGLRRILATVEFYLVSDPDTPVAYASVNEGKAGPPQSLD